MTFDWQIVARGIFDLPERRSQARLSSGNQTDVISAISRGASAKCGVQVRERIARLIFGLSVSWYVSLSPSLDMKLHIRSSSRKSPLLLSSYSRSGWEIARVVYFSFLPRLPAISFFIFRMTLELAYKYTSDIHFSDIIRINPI